MSFTNLSSEDLRQEARSHKNELLQTMFPRVTASAVGGAAPQPTVASIPRGHNIRGVGFGAKITTGAMLGSELALIVYVRRKLPKNELDANEIVPEMIDKYPSDVVAVGDIRPYARPVPCGVSCGHYRVTAGTLGCLVSKGGDSQKRYILSNNHVLANSNDAEIGDAIMEPGPMDAKFSLAIANLTDFEPLNIGPSSAANYFDAAIAEVIDVEEITPDIKMIGNVDPNTMPATLYQSVRKHGRTTGHTIGVVMDVSADITVYYGTQAAQFEDQMTIRGAGGAFFSQGGDSGSLVVDGVTRKPVGLLFAGGGDVTFANPIVPILQRFGASIL